MTAPTSSIERVARIIKRRKKTTPRPRLSWQVKLVAIAPRTRPEKQAQLLCLARELESLGL